MRPTKWAVHLACSCSCSVASDSLWPRRLWPTRLLCPWDFQVRMLEWVAIPFSRESSLLRIEPASPASPALAGGFFTIEPPGNWLRIFLSAMPPSRVRKISTAFRGLAACLGFLGGSDSKETTYNAGDLGSVPRLGRSPGERHGSLFQYSCQENPHGQRSPWGCKESDTTEAA